MEVLRSTRTVVHFVTLLEDMPVTETEEAVAALGPTGIRVGTVVENMVSRMPLRPAELAAAAGGQVVLNVPGWSAMQNAALAAEFAVEAAQAAEQQIRHDRLRTLGLPLAQLDFDPAGIDVNALVDIARQLSAQLDLEVG